MKKLLIALTAVLAFGSGVADAAVPEGGYFLDKNGVPLTKEQSTPPKLKTHPTPPMSRLVYNAVKALPHSSSTIIRLTVNEDGFPVGPAVTQSAGSVILDEYAVKSVINWTFILKTVCLQPPISRMKTNFNCIVISFTIIYCLRQQIFIKIMQMY